MKGVSISRKCRTRCKSKSRCKSMSMCRKSKRGHKKTYRKRVMKGG